MSKNFLLPFFFLLGITTILNGQSDTLRLEQYLKLFDHTFSAQFDEGWRPLNDSKKLRLTFSPDKQIINYKINLSNGRIAYPNIYGWAYSFKKINDTLIWLIYYRETESGGV